MDPSTIDCVIYHGGCSDGFAAAWAAWKVLGNRAEYIAAHHSQQPPDVTGKNVLVLDFAYDKKTTRQMMRDAGSFAMRDHHKTAMVKLEGIAKAGWFQLEHSGCILSWDFFHPGVDVPRFLRFIENRDQGWKPYMEYSYEFSLAFDMKPMDFETYDKMLHASYVDECIKRGAHILPYAESAIDKACASAVKRRLRGYDVMLVNSTHWISEIGTRLARDCDFALVWYWNHREGYAKASLRSINPEVDCSSIARRFGGGGHEDIAGFEFRGNIEDIFAATRDTDDATEPADSSDE
jgi:uncharacterized protein